MAIDSLFLEERTVERFVRPSPVICHFCDGEAEYQYTGRSVGSDDDHCLICRSCGALNCGDCGSRLAQREASDIGRKLGFLSGKYCPACTADDTNGVEDDELFADDAPVSAADHRHGKTVRDRWQKLIGKEFVCVQRHKTSAYAKRGKKFVAMKAVRTQEVHITVTGVRRFFDSFPHALITRIRKNIRLSFLGHPELDEEDVQHENSTGTYNSITAKYHFNQAYAWEGSFNAQMREHLHPPKRPNHMRYFKPIADASNVEISEPSPRPKKHKPRARRRWAAHRVAYTAAEARAVLEETGQDTLRDGRQVSKGRAARHCWWSNAAARTECPRHWKSGTRISKIEHIRSLRKKAERRREDTTRVTDNGPIFNELLLRLKYSTAGEMFEESALRRYERALSRTPELAYTNLFRLERLETLSNTAIIIRDDVLGSMRWMEENERELVRAWRERQHARLAKIFPRVKREELYPEEDL